MEESYYQRNIEKRRAYQRKYVNENRPPESRRTEYDKRNEVKRERRRLQREERFRMQGGVCAICRRPSSKMCDDHNHETGEKRGLLCSNCNVGLGLFRDSVDVLQNAVVYLQSY